MLAGAALSSTGIFSGPGAVLFVAGADSIRASWTGKPTILGSLAGTVVDLTLKDDASKEFAQKTGDFVQSLAGGGASSLYKTVKGTGNAADALGSAGAAKDANSFAEGIRVYECSGRISCGEMREEK
jgi:hypothetical protein